MSQGVVFTPEQMAALERFAHLTSPAALAIADTNGKWKMRNYLDVMNRKLAGIPVTPGSRQIFNAPWQHGKTKLVSNYFPAWTLLLFPDTRVILVSNEEEFAISFGSAVKDIIERWGPDIGIKLRQDTKAKGEWRIDKAEGGMVCRGMKGAVGGRPADCLVGETRILTKLGYLRLDHLCSMPIKPLVLSYNHATGKAEWRSIRAVRKTYASQLLEFRTQNGCSLCCTGRHRLYTLESGYQAANHVCRGQNFLAHLSHLRASEGTTCQDLPSLLFSDKAGGNPHSLRMVRDFRATTARRFQQDAQAELPRLLLSCVFDSEPEPQMQEVRQANGQKYQSLLRRLPSSRRFASSETQTPYLRAMPQGVQAQVTPEPMLFAALCQSATCGPDDRCWQSTLQDRHQLCQLVSAHAPAHPGTGRSSLPDLRLRGTNHLFSLAGCSHEEKQLGDSPHQRTAGGQPRHQSRNDLLCLPQEIPQHEFAADAVRMVQRLHVDRTPVYDIQVEGNGNFFANDLLVHNCFIIEDPIKDAEQAMSPIVMDAHWDWYRTVVFGRARAQTSIVVVTTRWTKKDLCGRILDDAKVTGEKWDVVKFPALAKENDILGRKVGEPLCPEVRTKEQWEAMRKTSRWWAACAQQDPKDDENAFFKPDSWPLYHDVGSAFSLQDGALGRKFVQYKDLTILITVDWATSEKVWADFTCIGVFGLTPDGKLLVLEIVNKRLALENCVPELAMVCRKWKPHLVAVETLGFQASLATECRRFPDIPEPRRLRPEQGANAKQRRAVPAIIMGENSRIYLPAENPKWLEAYKDQLSGFTGSGDDHDDMCVAHGTLIATARGPVPVQDICAGETVWTRKGLRQVVWAGMTNSDCPVECLLTTSGLTLTATAKHPVWVEGKGFCTLDSLAYGDRLLAWQNHIQSHERSRLNMAGLSGLVIRIPLTDSTGFISSIITTGARPLSTCIAGSGQMLMDLFRRVFMCITRMATRLTMTWKIWSASLSRIIARLMQHKGTIPPNGSESTLQKFVLLQASGTSPQRDEPGTVNMPRRISPSGNPSPCNASNAATITRQPTLAKTVIAPTSAIKRPAEPAELTTWSEPVLSAAMSSGSTSAVMPPIVPVRVRARVILKGRLPVYNLSVAGENEYFANGILVHNCDVTAYAAQMAHELRQPSSSNAQGPTILTGGWTPQAG